MQHGGKFRWGRAGLGLGLGLILAACQTVESSVDRTVDAVTGRSAIPFGTPGHVTGFLGGAAADEPRAAIVARDILSSGGSAVDAAVAGAMDCQVEIHFAGPSVKLLLPGVAEGLRSGAASDKTLYVFMQEAAGFGARFLGCSMAMAEHLAARADRIPEFSAAAGAGAFVSRTLDPDWRTLVF